MRDRAPTHEEEALLPPRAVFDHVAHAAHRIEDLLPLYAGQLGGRPIYSGPNRRLGYHGMVLEYEKGGKIELLEPLPGSAFFDSFFARHGEGGLHHLTFRVPCLHDAIARARAVELQVVGLDDADPHWRQAFVHPRSAHGALIQFVEAPDWYPLHDTPTHTHLNIDV
jgi:methylmalonyl-CoA/ethylmalonyl-CoA epimerase